MPYVIENDTTLPRVVASGTDAEGNEYAETERVAYSAGQVVYEDDIAPDMLERLESGNNEHLSSLVKHVSESEAQRLVAERGGSNVVAPEHEAEAEVLYQDGKDVLTRDEVVESNPNGDAVTVEEEVPDVTEEREPEDPDSLRSTEVDEKRRGDGDAPEPIPAADDVSGGSGDGDKTVAELKDEAKELDVPGYSTMKKAELESAIASAKAQDQS